MASALKHLALYFLGLDPAQTQTTAAERNAISRYAIGKHRVVEIGVFEGVTTGVIASALPADAVLFAIDPFIAGRVGICWGKPIAQREAHRHSPKCKIQFVEAFSHQANKIIEGTFDLLFIDGDHSLDGITRDWADWSDRIQPGGIVALHDTVVPAHNPRVAGFGSHKYFNDHIRHDTRFEIIEQVDSLSILSRRSHSNHD